VKDFHKSINPYGEKLKCGELTLEYLDSIMTEGKRFQIHDILSEAERRKDPEPQVEKLIGLLGSSALDELLNDKIFPTGAILRAWRSAGKRTELEELADRTYRFEAWPSRRKYKSQTLKFQGNRRLKHFDKEIRKVFDLDSLDHAGEFFLAVGRGWDSWGLGPIYPDGTGKSKNKSEETLKELHESNPRATKVIYFDNVDIPDVGKLALYGSSLADSSLYQEYLDHGNIWYAVFEIEERGIVVGATRNSVIVLFSKLETQEFIDFILEDILPLVSLEE